jgi:hypothetical protein
MQLGNAVAVPTLASIAALTKRFRLARDVLLSGLLAYYAADLVKGVVGRERPTGLPVGAVLHDGVVAGAGFISGHAAVAAAMATAETTPVQAGCAGGCPTSPGGARATSSPRLTTARRIEHAVDQDVRSGAAVRKSM